MIKLPALLLMIALTASAEAKFASSMARRVEAVINMKTGRLLAIKNGMTGEDCRIISDSCMIRTETEVINLASVGMSLTSNTKTRCVFVGKSGGIKLEVAYRYPVNRGYFDRTLKLTNVSREPILLKSVTDCALEFAKPFDSAVFHDDNMNIQDEGAQGLYESDKPEYYHNSLNVFMRGKSGGITLGLKYPYWKSTIAPGSTLLTYETNYRLKPAETLELPTAFFGVYKKTGFTCRKELDWKPRIISTQQEEMDWGEVRAMQEVLRDFLPQEMLPTKGYMIWLNAWWANRDLQGRISEKESLAYCNLMRSAKQTQCVDLVSTAPVWVGWANFISPCPEIDAIGEDARFPMNDDIQRVVDGSQAIHCDISGFSEPNALARHYRKDRLDWKLEPEPGKRLNQNCHANPDYEDWFYRLTCSAIDTCKLKGWAWDHCWVRRPMVCYGENHGHEPGNCEFQQYKNVANLIRKLRQRYPDNILEIYWGLKEAGTWGHKGLNSLENLYENNSPAPPGMTAADDLRFQHWYNHNYRFFPTYMDLAHINFAKEANGHLYSILSCLSASTYASLADWVQFKTDAEAAQIFGPLRNWKAWATKNMVYLKDRVDIFGQPCRKGGIDGTAHIIADRGFIFVFNPTKDAHWGSIRLDSMIGLTKGMRYSLDEISSGARKNLGVCDRGDEFTFLIPARSAMLIELMPSSAKLMRMKAPADVTLQPAFVK